MEMIRTIAAATGILGTVTGAIVGLGFWLLRKKIAENEEKRKDHESQQEALQMIILDSVNGLMDLTEATARAVKNGHCNGDMTKALEDLQETKKRQQRMLTKAGVHNIVHD